MPAVIQSILTVRGDDALERAIAADVSVMDDNDFSHNFLEQMSVEYPKYKGKRKLVVEDPSNEGQSFIADDLDKDKKIPQND